MDGILDGVRIMEMGHVVAVPAATATLADWGADVIKIEPLTGDMARGFKRIVGVDTEFKGKGGETSWYVQVLNRNKKSLAVDLKTESGREIMLGKTILSTDAFKAPRKLSLTPNP